MTVSPNCILHRYLRRRFESLGQEAIDLSEVQKSDGENNLVERGSLNLWSDVDWQSEGGGQRCLEMKSLIICVCVGGGGGGGFLYTVLYRDVYRSLPTVLW